MTKLIIIIWIVCGIHNFGASLADFSSSHHSKSDYIMSGFFALIGPLGVIPVVVGSNYYEHGFRFK